MRDYQMMTITVLDGKAVNTMISGDETAAINHAKSCVKDYVSDAKSGKSMPSQVVVIKQNKDFNETVWEWTPEEEIKKEIAELESLHRIQVQNGRHYYWNEEDDEKASYWQEQADGTKASILKLKKKYNINTPNWWEI